MKKIEFLEQGQSPETEKQNLSDYIAGHSKVLVNKNDFTEELKGMIMPGKSILGYFDSKNVTFSVVGYDLIYVDEDGDLSHVKIRPEEISDLEGTGKVGESDYIEDQLIGIGFIFDRSELFRSALYRQLNKE